MAHLRTEEYKNYNLIYNKDLFFNKDYKVVEIIASKLLSDINSKELEVFSKHSRKNIDVYRFKERKNELGYFIKYFYMRRWDYYLKDMLIEPIGLGAFKKSLALIELGVPVAEPVAAVTINGPLFKKDSILINREIPNNFTLLKLFSDDNLLYINNDQIIDLFIDIGKIFGIMINNNFIHTDPNPKNFLVQKIDSKLDIYLIDIDDIFDLSFLPLPEFIKLSTVASFLADIKARLINKNYDLELKVVENFMNGFLNIYSSKNDNEYIKNKINRFLEDKLKRRR